MKIWDLARKASLWIEEIIMVITIPITVDGHQELNKQGIGVVVA